MSSGTCDGLVCFAGCTCGPAAEGIGVGICSCATDAGDAGNDSGIDAAGEGGDAASDAMADAASDAMTDAASDAMTDAASDAATDADSTDATSDAGPPDEPCGVITCAGGCICADVGSSSCVCP